MGLMYKNERGGSGECQSETLTKEIPVVHTGVVFECLCNCVIVIVIVCTHKLQLHAFVSLSLFLFSHSGVTSPHTFACAPGSTRAYVEKSKNMGRTGMCCRNVTPAWLNIC